MAVEETKEQQQIYNIFRSCIYIFLICEIIVNLPITAHDPVRHSKSNQEHKTFRYGKE